MKSFKKLLALSVATLALGTAGAIAVAQRNSANSVAPVHATTSDGYTTYYNTDLGFNSRNAGVNLVVIGDADGGMQTKGNVLDVKSELNLRFKSYNYDLWIGVGGYAVYVSGGSVLRFLYLTHKDSSAYNRNVELGNLQLKTADGSTSLLSVISGGKYFSDYLNVVYRWDLSNLTAVKASFHAIYNGVTYYPFDGSTRIDEITYTHQAIDFAASDTYRAMMGANAGDSGIDLIKFKTEEKKLDDMISFVASSQDFNYDYIGDFCFNFQFTERIFAREKDTYLNDHLSSFLDENGAAINLGDGILINGKTFNYWVNYTDSDLHYVSDDPGVHQFPLKNSGATFTPVALFIAYATSNLKFMMNTDYIAMDSMVITFKAGVFAGYYNGVKFTLSNDVTFYSSLEDTNSTDINHRKRSVVLTKTINETVHTDYEITELADHGVHTNSHGFNYYKYTIWTNIPRNTNLNNGWTQDHYRYLYNNILLNGKTLSRYNSWARANSLDSTDEYETVHATGSANTQFDLAVQLQIATDQTNFVFFIYFPYQLMDDQGYTGTPVIALREGAAWLTPSGVARINYKPVVKNTVDAFVEGYMHLQDVPTTNHNDTGACRGANGYYLAAKAAYNQLTAEQKALFASNPAYADAVLRYEAWAVANNDAAPYDGYDAIVSPLRSNIFANTIFGDLDKNTDTILVISIVAANIIILCGLVILKKKRAR